ncbi:interleukin-11 receptor subunit alpha isoform X2 [Mixophyes fleayi]|uniref:interleukin-11 receptor subunit alpha isoform X2 n=1 Tax=Mixophyes fleayi TaxID=3061075 RepID=UPI003F4DC705
MSSSASCLSRVFCLLAVTVVSVSLSSHTWEEEGVVYGRIGETVTLKCNSRNDSSVAEWRFNGSPDVSWGYFTNVGDLDLPSVGHSVMGNYTCHGHSGELLRSLLLKVGYLPGMPSVTCRASDYHNFSCYWKPAVDTLLPTRYITSYRVDRNSPEICLQDPTHPNMCSVRHSKLWTSYQMNITEENPLGSNFRILEFNVQSIVKPDPPEIMSAEPIPYAPRRLLVTWAYPSTWPQEPHFQLKFRLQYRSVLHMSWSVVETANLSDVITDAFVGTEHILQVSARDFLDAGNWSEWSVEARATPWIMSVSEVSNKTTTEEPEPQVKEPFVQNDSVEKVIILISLGIFGFVVLVLFLIFGALIWVRVGRTVKDSGIKANFLSAIHMKTLPKSQIL